MKQVTAFLGALLMTSFGALYAADYDIDDVSREGLPSIEQKAQQGPFTLTIEGDAIGRAKLHNSPYHGHIDYSHAEADLSAVFYYDPCCQEGAAVNANYAYTRMDWNRNPFFSRDDYTTFSLGLTYFTERFCNWRWLAHAAFFIDAENWKFRDYTWYDLVLWGRYSWCDNFGLNIGIYAETGMKLDLVLPIIGFDWTINECWKLNAIFPTNMALTYTWDNNWSFDAAIRIFSERHRANKAATGTDSIPGFTKAVWRYSNVGLEGGINYNLCDWLKANFHGGYTFGGRLKVANRHSHHSHRAKFDGAPYIGASLTLNF